MEVCCDDEDEAEVDAEGDDAEVVEAEVEVCDRVVEELCDDVEEVGALVEEVSTVVDVDEDDVDAEVECDDEEDIDDVDVDVVCCDDEVAEVVDEAGVEADPDVAVASVEVLVGVCVEGSTYPNDEGVPMIGANDLPTPLQQHVSQKQISIRYDDHLHIIAARMNAILATQLTNFDCKRAPCRRA